MRIIVISILYVLFLERGAVQSQTLVSLDTAIQIALRHNHQIQDAKLKQEYVEKLKAVSFQLDPTNFSLEYGQFNSIYTDKRVSVSQSFLFPTIFIAQKKVFKEEIKKIAFDTKQKRKDLIKTLSLTFYNYLFLKEKEMLLVQNDSLYGAFIEKAKARFQYGESDVLEKINVEIQKGLSQTQLIQLKQEIDIVLLEFQLLLNGGQTYIPHAMFKTDLTLPKDSFQVTQHPALQSANAALLITKSMTRLEKNKLLPNLFVAYNNTSIRGVGSDNNVYTGSDRFQSFQVGLGIPLFSMSQTTKIKASKIEQLIAQNNYDLTLFNMQNAWLVANLQYQNAQKTLRYFEGTGKDNVHQLVQVAKQRFEAGEIDYLQWAMLMNQAILLNIEYLNSIHNFNKSVIELLYLSLSSD